MLLWIMVIIGLCIFGFGVYSLIKNYKYGKYMRIYGECAYWGLGIVVLGGILLMEPVFTKLPGTLSTMLPFWITISIFMVVTRLLLKLKF